PYSWEGQIRSKAWQPELRTFQVQSEAGGKLALHEQLFPGWTATIDGRSVAVESWSGAFQAVQVPPGEHTVEFRFSSRLLGVGGAISLIALIALVFWGRSSSRSTSDTAYPAVSG